MSYRSDILHCANNYSIALACFLSGKLTGRKVTISVWEIWDRLWFSFYNFISASAYWLYEKLILSLPFDVFIAPSRFVYGQIINVNQNNKKIIKLGHKNIKPNKKPILNNFELFPPEADPPLAEIFNFKLIFISLRIKK